MVRDPHAECRWAVQGSTDGPAKDPDAGDPINAFQKLGRHVHTIWRGVSSAEGIFALKYGLVSIALWVPAVAPRSSQFVYENRGLWALIMVCQLF